MAPEEPVEGDDAGIRSAATAELDPETLYGLLRLRVDVFVVEQACAYAELDGRDLEPGARHWWIPGTDGAPLAYLRVLDEPGGGCRIGRVVTAPTARGRGLAATLLRAALADAGRPAVLDAQVQLEHWYAGFGFTVAGPPFVEDGIPHVPMVLP
jgi:ElaA protein